jgi:hypothetical protein
LPDSKPEALRELERAAPGTRFRRIYEARQGSSHGGLKNRAFMFGGLAVIAAGVATYPIPVIPSELVILVGLALLSQGSARGARMLDGAEVRFRRWLAPAIRVVSRWPKWAKVAAGVAWSCVLAALSWWAWRSLHR